MVIEMDACPESDALKASGNYEVKCVDKKIHDNDDDDDIQSRYMDELRMEFASLSTLTNFNRVADEVKPLYATPEKIVCEMVVKPQNVNAKGTLHGGQTASLTDIITARAIGLTIRDQAMASIELSVSYFLPVKLGDVIEITAHVLKLGRNVAFTEAEFRRKSDGKLAAKGRHTVAILPKQPQADGQKVAQY
ncbi:hypothetical protein DICVIV_06954 [Dictyocaulus viviparus]|uniref:Acyl-coenzyme A thioesterase 13 n=1 Tax=Dictyocaulus viviparus TaxID=29172 RepID=A0A0D8XQP2_DICVI|nr:hypothetical protein DICVIV_06954 [Dictyocaulus viviparus]